MSKSETATKSAHTDVQPAESVASKAEGNEDQPAKLSPTQNEEGDKKKEEGGGQTESLIRSSYLPVNKLHDAPPASHYEGRSPEEFTGTKGPGVGASISKGVHDLKEKIVPHHKDK